MLNISRYIIGFIVLMCITLTMIEIPASYWFSFHFLSFSSAICSFSLMAMSCILASRWRVLERFWGGLDRVYESHKWFGIFALVFASLHLLFKAHGGSWDVTALLEISKPVARFIRQFSFIALMFVVLLALNRNIKYSEWYGWHRLSGIAFVVIIIHWLTVKVPFELSSPMGYWLLAMSLLGFLSILYKWFLYALVANHKYYEVSKIQQRDGSVEITLLPIEDALEFEPGQFAFLSFRQKELREPHPFTIAESNRFDGQVSFVIRSLGDYTERLTKSVKAGLTADIYGPYGNFQRGNEGKHEIWVAGGVGVTPFIAWMKDVEAGNFHDVDFYYFYNEGHEFPKVKDLQAMCDVAGVRFYPLSTRIDESNMSHNLKRIVELNGADGIDVCFCGPKSLLSATQKLMDKHGVPETAIRHEMFTFR
ncbi:ferredoxin reductase family protein [Echinimonas agarilytica]|uniref:Ferredoxin reductase family protein n=1 Tax=Echinimonas agarilytica TaxID=1215918 RepID=A0AA41W8H6_9GAMM|nr:ferredoxin reductase family protein [Echinimonas agarilytica]MCM2680418.1 ferredoxin reductase family protein [Echinimonas agarilytica]